MSNAVNSRETRPYPWKCGHCGERAVYPSEEVYTTEVVHDGRTYTVTVPALRLFRCRNCGEAILDTEANRRISQAFRQEAGLLMPEEIRQKRKALGLTQEELAERLSVAKATLSRWETGGQIQQRCLDKLLRLFFELFVPAPPADGGATVVLDKLRLLFKAPELPTSPATCSETSRSAAIG